ncbi:DedA family protein [Pseudofrankia sp. DC12]|uniref:DedA family protein n=1 Tax=Pseudofrankia sp. DC12 TaxID=683315 RepID=UPI0005F7C3F1|nr:DedA family protein [Pseudofrankia sp. DC12]
MEHFITTYGIAAVFVLMVLESACIPIPSEVTMLVGGAMSAGAFAGSKPSLVLVIAAGVVGNVIGSYIAWAVGRYGGTPLIMRFGKYIFLREHDLDKAERWFDNRGAVSVLVGRLLPVIRTFISLPAGIARMNPVKFGIYTTLGCIPWTAALAIVGYQVGGNYKHIADDFHGPTYIIAVIVLVVALFLAYRHIKRSRAAANAAGVPGAPGRQDDRAMAVDRRGPRHRRGGAPDTRDVPDERPGSDQWTDDRDQTRARW